MTREDVKKIFPNATDDEITAFLNQHNSEVNSAKGASIKDDDLKELREKAKKFEEYEREKLSNEERVKIALEQAEKARRDNLMLLNKTKAEAIFVADGLASEDYKDFIDSIVKEDENDTLSSAKAISKMLQKRKAAWEQEYKDNSISKTPKPDGKTSEKKDDNDKKDQYSAAEQLAISFAKSRADAAKVSAENLKNIIGG